MKTSPYTRPEIYLERRAVPLNVANDCEQLVERDEGEEISPGAAILSSVVMWIDEHWPAVAGGFALGLIVVGIPALVVARLMS